MPPTHALAPVPRSPRWPALLVWPAVLVLTSSASSCSVIGMQRLEPDLPKGAQPECTSTWTMPMIDFGLVAISGSAGVLFHAAAAQNENDDQSNTGFRVAGWSAIGVAAVFIASGAYGAYQRSRCRRAEVAFEGAGEPAFLRESRPLKGAEGSSCEKDEDCDEDLLCGQPMKTCIPANAPEESPPP